MNINPLDTLRFTPPFVVELQPDEIFVFGSNSLGRHGGGAARLAYRLFGAIWGQGVGLQGQSYAIPTMDGSVEAIRPYVDQFTAFADECDQNTFLVTAIGCGIAGYLPSQIAPLFADALPLYNVRLPREFVEIICSPRYTRSLAADPTASYTLADMLADYRDIVLRFRPYLGDNLRLLAERVRQTVDTYAFSMVTPLIDLFSTPIEPTREGVERFVADATRRLDTSYPYLTPWLRFELLQARDRALSLIDTPARDMNISFSRSAAAGSISSAPEAPLASTLKNYLTDESRLTRYRSLVDEQLTSLNHDQIRRH